MQANPDTVALVPAPTIEVEAQLPEEAFELPVRAIDNGSLRWHGEALRRQARLALAVFLLVVGAAAVYLFTATPIYEARVKLLVEPESPNVVAFKEVIEQNTSKLDYYETQLGILRSRSLARKTIDALGLWTAPELSDGGGTIDAFLSRLQLTYRADNRLVDVRVRSADPRRAADIANTHAQMFIADKVATKVEASKHASTWLETRVAEQRRQVEESELALQAYRESNPEVSLADQQNIAGQKLADLSAASTRAKTERIEAESLHSQLRAIENNPAAFDTLPASLSNAYVQQLKSDLASLQREEATRSQRLGERHPDMLKLRSAIERTQGQLTAEVARIAESVRSQTRALEARELSLSGAIEAQRRQLLGFGRKTIEYAALEREAASNRQLLQGLLQRAKEAELSSELNASNVRIVDPAEVPLSPASPRRNLILLLSLLIAVPLAIGSALARETLDDRIKSPEDITSDLRIRFLGFAPSVPKKIVNKGVPIVNDRAVPEFAEALRGVRANLLLSAPARDGRSLLVTSTGPGEGKTLVASNLAVALAQGGRRVLLVDADMRRAQLHNIFGQPLEPGLADVLQGSTAIAAALRPTTTSGLSILTAGVSAGIPGDLLQPHLLVNTLASVRDGFDWIVIDSPPVLAASDAVALAHAAAAVVFVIGAHMVNARQARAALEQLAPSGAKIVGAILSRSNEGGRSPYSYARYSRYYQH